MGRRGAGFLSPGRLNQIISLSLPTTESTSSFVLYLLNEKRTATWLGLLLMARITCEPWSAPLVQALPPLAQILPISRLNSSISDLSVLGKDTFSTVYRLFPSGSPLKATPSTCFVSCSIIYSFTSPIYLLSSAYCAVASSSALAKPTIP